MNCTVSQFLASNSSEDDQRTVFRGSGSAFQRVFWWSNGYSSLSVFSGACTLAPDSDGEGRCGIRQF